MSSQVSELPGAWTAKASEREPVLRGGLVLENRAAPADRVGVRAGGWGCQSRIGVPRGRAPLAPWPPSRNL